MIRQISVFIQNEDGKLGKVLNVLAQNGIDIRSLTIAETADYGLLRLILQDTDKGLLVLKDAGIMASVNEVMAVEIPDRPGGLSTLINVLAAEKINIAYAYSYWPIHAGKVIVVFKTDDADVEKVKTILADESEYHFMERDELLQS